MIYKLIIIFLSLNSIIAFSQETVTVDVAQKNLTGLNLEEQERLLEDLKKTATVLVQKGDPQFNIILVDNLRAVTPELYISTKYENRKVPSSELFESKDDYMNNRSYLELKPGATLAIPTGYFVFANNQGEIAGLLAFQMSRLIDFYETALKNALKGVSLAEVSTESIQKELDRIEDKIKQDTASHQEKIKVISLKHVLELQQHYNRLKNTEDKITKLWKDEKFEIKENEDIIQRLRAAHMAIDRMTNAGFNPIDLLNASEEMLKLDLKLTGSSVIPFKSRITHKEERKRKINIMGIELGFISQYVGWLVEKKITVTPYKTPLSDEQRKLRFKASIVQMLAFGPFGAKSGSAIGIGVFAYTFGSTILNMGGSIANSISNLINDPVSKSSRSALSDATDKFGRNASEVTGQHLADLSEKASRISESASINLGIGEKISGLFSRGIDHLGTLWGGVEKTSGEFYRNNLESTDLYIRQSAAEAWNTSYESLGNGISTSSRFLGRNWSDFWSMLGSFKDSTKTSITKVAENVSEKSTEISFKSSEVIEGTPFLRDAFGAAKTYSIDASNFIMPYANEALPVMLTYGLPAIAAAMILKIPYDLKQIASGSFMQRKKHMLMDQKIITSAVQKWEQTDKNIDELIELAKRQNEVAVFVEESYRIDKDKAEARVLYSQMFRPGGFNNLFAGTELAPDLFNEFVKRSYDSIESIAKKRYEEVLPREIKRSTKYSTWWMNLGLRFAMRSKVREKIRKEKIWNSVLEQVAQEQFFEKMLLKGEHANGVRFNFISEYSMYNTINNYKIKNKRLINSIFGWSAIFSSSYNLHNLLVHINDVLNRKDISKGQREDLKNVLVNMNAIDHLSKKTQKYFIETLKTHVPELQFNSKIEITQLNSLLEQNKISIANYNLFLLYLGQTKSSSTARVTEILRALMEKGHYREGMLYLSKNMSVISKSGHPEIYKLTENLIENIDKSHASLWVREYLKHKIMVQALLLKNKDARVAIFKSMAEVDYRAKTLFIKPFGRFITSMLSGHLKSAKTLDSVLLNLKNISNYGMPSSYISGLFLNLISKNPQIIRNNSDIKRIFKDSHLFKAVDSNGVGKLSSWENAIYKAYTKLGEQFDSFRYDPGHSEKIQKIILKRFSEINQNPSLESRLEIWRLLASRGPSGLTDAMIEELYQEIKEPTLKEKWSRIATADGLVWDKDLRSEMYKPLIQNKFSPAVLDRKSEQKYKAIGDISVKYVRGMITEESFLKKFNQNLNPYTLENKKELKSIKKILKAMRKKISDKEGTQTKKGVRRSLTKRKKLNLEKRKISQNKRLTDNSIRKTVLTPTVKSMTRYSVLNDGRLSLVKRFPDGGSTLVELMNWMSNEFRTSQNEAYFLNKLPFIDELKKNEDLGNKVINELIEKVSSWEKADKWHFILWLRGKRDIPPMIAKERKYMGPETIRRLYESLPIGIRQVMITALIQSPVKPLLEPIKKFQLLSDRGVYYEQILDEILPQNKESAEVAKEVLEAFLETTREGLHERVSNILVSFLLANHASKNNQIGEVVKNTLESYGVVGIKLGQFLATADFMPEEIREALKTLRDNALPLYRHEIYEKLQEYLDVKHVDKHFKLIGIVGSASIKVVVLVEDKAGKQHVVSITRDEAIGPLEGKFFQLESIIKKLIKKNPERWTAIKKYGEATISSLMREISIPEEKIKDERAMKDYRQIMQEIGMEDSKTEKLHIPKTTDLIESINPNALEFLRSAEYVEGKTIENFEKEDQKVFARRILEIGAYRFYPNKHFKNGADISPGETRVVDTDRHPGNELLNKDGEVFHWFPIDFGQELPFTIKMVENVHILMGATQIIENIGAHKIILEKMVKDLGITANISKLQKDLTQFFPNKGKLPRSSMVTYSLLLEVLEKHGFQVDMFYSEFTKGIFQYEAYEEIIRGEKYLSPKKDFTFEVMKKVDEWRSYLLANMNDDIKKKSAKDLILISPLAALRAYENLNFVNKGQVEVRNFLLTLGIESSTVKSLLAKLSNPKTAAELKEFVTEAAKIKKIKRKERLILSSWSNHLRVKNIDVKLFSLPEFITLSTLSGIVKDVAPSTVKMKLKGAYPQHLGAVKSFTTIYGGELIDRVYHGLKNRDPELAIAWFQEFFTLSKHLGLINFAIGSGVYKSLANKYIRSSRKYFKAINMHGISMAIGMTLSDITIRAMDGQSVEEIVDHVISSKNGRELTFGVLAFLAAEGVISQAGGVLSKILPVKGKMNCQNWFAQAGRMGAVFIVASEIDELTREELVDLGVLDEDTYMHLDQQKKKYIKEVENQSKTIENILKQENIDFKKISKLYYGEIFSPTELLSKTCSAMLPYTIRTKTDKEMSYVGKLQAFEKKLSIIQFNTQDKSVEKLIGTFDLKQIFLRKMDRVTNELCHGLREGNLI